MVFRVGHYDASNLAEEVVFGRLVGLGPPVHYYVPVRFEMPHRGGTRSRSRVDSHERECRCRARAQSRPPAYASVGVESDRAAEAHRWSCKWEQA